MIRLPSEGAKLSECTNDRLDPRLPGPREGGENIDVRRRSRVITRLHTTPRMTITKLPTPQTAQTAADSPPANADAWLRAASMAGLKPGIMEVSGRASSGGIQGASQSGTRKL